MLKRKIAEYYKDIEFFVKTLSDPSQKKHALLWWISRSRDFLIKEQIPWMTFDAVDFIMDWLALRTRINVFEYGSGGSTLFWIKNNASIISVEHNPEWYEYIKKFTLTYQKIDLRLILPEDNARIDSVLDPANPFHYATSDGLLRKKIYKQYVSQIDTFPDHYFDVVLIDGRARPSCILHSIPKVKREGILILDDAERAHYLRQTFSLLKEFQKTTFRGVGPIVPFYKQTNIYCYSKVKGDG